MRRLLRRLRRSMAIVDEGFVVEIPLADVLHDLDPGRFPRPRPEEVR